ncbi:MAG TPA: transposase [Segetibacter sp.]|nr:transposase [Segetibacter sp.]
MQLLDSIPGIAEETAILLMMDIESIDNYSSAKQLCAQFGMHPTFKQSGDGTWAPRLSKMGRSSVRGLLYMPALTAIRSNDYFKNLYAQQRAKGKKHRQAICVVMHKMLCIVFGVLKRKTPFNIEIHSTNQQQSEQKQKEAEIKQQQHNKEKKTKRDRYISINQLEAPISRKQSKRIKKELPVPIDKNQDVRDPEALNKGKQIPCLLS